MPKMRRRRRESPQDIIAESQRLLHDASGKGRRARLALTEQALARFPEHAFIRLEYASALGQFDRDRAATEALRAVALDRTADAVLLTRAAMLLLSLGELAAARSCVEQAHRTGPTNLVIVNQLTTLRGELALAEGDHESWERFLKAAHEAEPENEDHTLNLAAQIVVASNGARLAEAIEVVEQTLRTRPSPDPRSVEKRATLEGRRKEYAAFLEDASSRPPQPGRARETPSPEKRPNPNTHPGADQDTPRSGDTANATATEAPWHAAANAVLRAQTLHANGEARQYRSFTERAVSRFPNDAAIRLEHATALAATSPAAALMETRLVGKLEAENELTRTALLLRAGRLAIELGAVQDAHALAESATDGASAHVMLANELCALNGRIAAANGEAAVAEAELRRAHQADPIHSVYALDLAQFLLASNRRDDALQVIERTLATPQRDGLFEMRAGQQLERLRTQLRERDATG
jgi:tetratricopeptide (TPR) repeat protein